MLSHLSDAGGELLGAFSALPPLQADNITCLCVGQASIDERINKRRNNDEISGNVDDAFVEKVRVLVDDLPNNVDIIRRPSEDVNAEQHESNSHGAAFPSLHRLHAGDDA